MNKGNWISNDELYNITNQTQWSKIVACRRLRFFGHNARLDEKAPAKVALYEAIRPVKRPKGKPSNTLLLTSKKQLKEL